MDPGRGALRPRLVENPPTIDFSGDVPPAELSLRNR